MDTFAGMLLVAPPQLTDPNFAETVVLVLLHNETGSFGLVLNRLASQDSAISGWDHPLRDTWVERSATPIRIGGPVESNESIVGIGRAKTMTTPSGYQAIETATLGPVGLVDLSEPPSTDIVDIRLFAGYSGWGPGQLEGEVLMGGWVVVRGLPSDAFDTELATLRGRVLRRTNRDDQQTRLLPNDITLN